MVVEIAEDVNTTVISIDIEADLNDEDETGYVHANSDLYHSMPRRREIRRVAAVRRPHPLDCGGAGDIAFPLTGRRAVHLRRAV